MAMSDMREVIDSFDKDTPFMADERDPRTIEKERTIATAPQYFRELSKNGLSDELVLRLIKMEKES